MIMLGALPWLVGAVLCVAGPRAGQLLPARAAVTLLTVLALATATATGLTLSVLGLLAIGEVPRIAALAHWSAPVLRASSPVPLQVGILGAAVVCVLAGASLLRAYRIVTRLAGAALTCRGLGPAPGSLVVVEDDHPFAYALPGLTGRIIVTTSMLRALQPDERRALLAHEAAHLRHHHYAYVQLAELAAAANPLLRPLVAAVRIGVERWADEDAAEHTGDRRIVARSLAVAGLARAHAGWHLPDAALGAADSEVRQRVNALLAPRAKPNAALIAILIAMTFGCLMSTTVIGVSIHALFETAQAAYHPAP